MPRVLAVVGATPVCGACAFMLRVRSGIALQMSNDGLGNRGDVAYRVYGQKKKLQLKNARDKESAPGASYRHKIHTLFI